MTEEKRNLSWNEVARLDDDAVRRLEGRRGLERPSRINRDIVTAARFANEEEASERAETIQKILHKDPTICKEADMHGFRVLGHAALFEVSFPIVKVLADAYPAAIRMKNGDVLDHAKSWDDSTHFDYLWEKLAEYFRSTLPNGTAEIREFFLAYTCKYVTDEDDTDEYRVRVGHLVLDEFPSIATERGENEETPFLLHEMRLFLFEQLLERVVSLNPQALVERNQDGETPLHRAIKYSDEIVHEDANWERQLQRILTPESARIADNHGFLPLHQLMTFAGPPISVMRALVEAFPDSVKAKTALGLTPLAVAVKSAYENLWRSRYFWSDAHDFLVGRYPEALKERSPGGWTPFQEMCNAQWGRRPEFIQEMVELCPDCIKVADDDGFTPLHHAVQGARCKRLPVIRFFMETFPEALTMKGADTRHTPLDVALDSKAFVHVITALAAKCPELLESTRCDGVVSRLYTFCAKISRSKINRSVDMLWTLDVLQQLACSEKVFLAADSQGRTPLHLLCGTGAPRQLVQAFIDKCPASALEAVDVDGRNPLHLLCSSTGVPLPLRRVLISALKAVDVHGRTPLHSAVMAYPANGVEEGVFEDTVAALLQAYPDSAFAVDNNGKTPLMIACEKDVGVSVIYRFVVVNPTRLIGPRLPTSLGKRIQES